MVFDSDDWGSTRVPSNNARSKLLALGIDMNDINYNKFDSLEGEDDLTALYEVLRKYRDSRGNHPIFEFNTVMGNPDFARIKDAGFTQYHWQPMQETYTRYFGKDLLPLWKEGISEKLIFPQFHAREHLNVSLWMKAIQQKLPAVTNAFDFEFYGMPGETPSPSHKHYLAAFHHTDYKDLDNKKDLLAEGLEIFYKNFGFYSKSFVACNYIWHRDIEAIAAKKKVKIIKTQRAQLEPNMSNGTLSTKFHYTGQKTKYNQQFLVRNAIFEPSDNLHYDWISGCLNQIEIAFFWGKPAVISTHRVNYIGSISEKNRSTNLALLAQLLDKMLKRWPELIFCTSENIFD